MASLKDLKDRIGAFINPVVNVGKAFVAPIVQDAKTNFLNLGQGINTGLQLGTQAAANQRFEQLMKSKQLADAAAKNVNYKQQFLTESRRIDQAPSLTRTIASFNQPLANFNLESRLATGMEGAYGNGGALKTLGRGVAPGVRTVATGLGLQKIAAAPLSAGSYFAPAIGATFGGIGAKLQGQDVATGIGQGLASGVRTLGFTSKFTDPAIDWAAGGRMAGMSALRQQLTRRSITGLGNMLEDELLAKMEGTKQGSAERLLSFGLGAFISPQANSDLVKKLKSIGFTPKEAEQGAKVIKETVDNNFVKNPNMPNGVIRESGLNPKPELPANPKNKKIITTRNGKPVTDRELNGLNAFVGASAGFEPEYDENGKSIGYKYNPIKGAIGMGAGFGAGMIKSKTGELPNTKTGLTPELTPTLTKTLAETPKSSADTLSSKTQTQTLDNLQQTSPGDILPSTKAPISADEAHYQVLSELDAASAGSRYMRKDGTFGGTQSTFPQWVPPEMRDRKLFDRVISNLSEYPNKIVNPKPGSKEDMLQDIVLGQIDTRTGVDTSASRLAQKIESIKGSNKSIKINSGIDKVEEALANRQVYNAEPTEKTLAKITKKGENIDRSNKIKQETRQYKEWQKQVFGQEQTRTTKQAIDDLSREIKKNTDSGVFNLDRSDGWKDKPKANLVRETMDRNFDEVMGQDAPAVKKALLDPIYKKEAERTRFLNKERSEIAALGIKAGSEESRLLQEFGEGKITADQLASKTKDPNKIINAASILRKKYDTYLDELNRVLTRNGYDPIPKRKDYFHHFSEINDVFSNIGVATKAENLPTDINGLTADFRPGKTFFTAALQRKGDKSVVDAIQGIDRYLEGASNQMFHTDNIQALRSFEKLLREKYAGTEHLSNFVSSLTEYTNTLAGKKSMLDRAVESFVGRQIFTALDNIKKQVGANQVGMNISSALTNFIPVTQTLATTNKKAVLQALNSIIANAAKDDGFINTSNFLTTRGGSDRLARNLWETVGDKTGWLFKTIDNFTSQLVVRSKYIEGINKGLSESEALRRADDWARKLMAGRGKGEMPILFNSKTLGFLTQFQLEVNNQLSFIAKDIPRNFDKVGTASAIGQILLYSYIYNNLYESLTGRRPAIDPIGIAKQAYEDYNNPNMKKGQASVNLTKNIANNLPFSSTFTGGRLPIQGAIPDPFAVMSGKSTLGQELTKPLPYLLPTGGGQIKKTVEGIGAFSKGASVTPSGGVRYPIEQTPVNFVKTAIFGQYSTPEAKKYFREGKTPLGEKQSQSVMQSGNTTQAFNEIRATQAENKQIEKVKQEMKLTGQKTATVGNKTLVLQNNGTVKTIDNSKPTKKPITEKTSSKKTSVKKPKSIKIASVKKNNQPKIRSIKVKLPKGAKTPQIKKRNLQKVRSIRLKKPKNTRVKIRSIRNTLTPGAKLI